MRANRRPARQRGVTLLEALIGILIFSVGVLSIIGIQALAIGHAGESRFRSEAAGLASDIVSQMWASVDRTSEASTTATVCAFALHASPCLGISPPTAAGIVKALENWQERVARLPSGTASIQVNPVGPSGELNFNQVIVTVNWRTSNGADHSFSTVANVY